MQLHKLWRKNALQVWRYMETITTTPVTSKARPVANLPLRPIISKPVWSCDAFFSSATFLPDIHSVDARRRGAPRRNFYLSLPPAQISISGCRGAGIFFAAATQSS